MAWAADRLALQRGARFLPPRCAGIAEAEVASLSSDAIAVASGSSRVPQRLLRASLFSDAFALEPARVVVPQASEGRRYHTRGGGACFGWAGLTTFGETTGPSNKGMKLTKPSILELRSLSLVFDRLMRER